jgi:hypothetical protein
MAIRFSCPHCQKTLNVKDNLGGKRAVCPACKQPITIPAPVAHAADLEELAARAFADEPAAPAPAAPEQATIEFVCYYCDAKVQVSMEFAGKQTSCPECRRITKVPALEKKEATDWRKLDTRPSGARRDTEPAPEGTWGTASMGTVSRQALVEAAAIPETKERLTWQQWTKRGVLAGAGLLVVGLGVWAVLHFLNQSRQIQAFAKAMQYLDPEPKVVPGAAAQLRHGVGEYYRRANQAENARGQFRQARDTIINALKTNKVTPVEYDIILIDLAAAQVELGGEKVEIDKGARLKWDDAYKEARQTAQNVTTPEGHSEAVREVSRRLIARGEISRAPLVATLFPDDKNTAGLLALVGLEILHANPDAKAKLAVVKLLEQAEQHLPKSVKPFKPGEKVQGPPPPAELIALWIALGKVDKVQELAPIIPDQPANAIILAGQVEGLVRSGKVKAARDACRDTKVLQPLDRLPALLAMAGVLVEDGQGEAARPELEQAFFILSEDPGRLRVVSPWLLRRLVQLGLAAGLQNKVKSLAQAIPDVSLRGRAELEVLNHQLAASKEPAEETAVQGFDKNSPAHGLAMLALARHNAHFSGSDYARTVDAWEPEGLRPFGYLGVALGLQD